MDPQQLESLYDEFAPAVHAFALQLSRNAEMSKDLLQNVFTRLVRRPRFTIFNPRSYLLRCTYRAYVDLVRSEASRQRALDAFAREPLAGFRAEPEDDEQITALLERLALLPEDQRAVVHLKIWEQRTFRQVAGILGISANTAASRFRYALDKLRGATRLENEHVH